MDNIISDLWFGNLRPSDNSGTNNPEIREIDNLVSRSFTKLEKILDENQREHLQKYSDNVEERLFLYSEQAFFDGFSLGAKLFAEAFIPKDNF